MLVIGRHGRVTPQTAGRPDEVTTNMWSDPLCNYEQHDPNQDMRRPISRPSVCSTMPRSRATVATGLPVLIISFTASCLNSGVNSGRLFPMMNILSFEVSTK